MESLPKVTVVGLGKIGLTLAAVFANNGYRVIGSDINQEIVKSVNQGISHVQNEPGVDQLVVKANKNHTLEATTMTSKAVSQSDIIVVIVPVLVDENNDIDYQFIDLAVQEIAKGIKKGALVVFETTLPPGTTRDRFGKKIEEISGLFMGKDFYLAYSPERVYSNRIIQDLKSYPKIIGALDQKSMELATDFYKRALGCEIINLSSLEAAEFSKVAECVYRDVNIALANELAKFAEKQNVHILEIIEASNSQPHSHIHSPGIGVGGHCIPIYPYFFINKGLDHGLTPLSRQINDSMAEHAILKLDKELGGVENNNILILGLSYRENVKETTKSTTLLLIDQLKEKNANVYVNDPFFSKKEIEQYDVSSLLMNDEKISDIDAIILQASHQEYQNIDFNKFNKCKVVLDGRNKLDKNLITSLGMTYLGIGND